jgi:type II secretion system protein C
MRHFLIGGLAFFCPLLVSAEHPSVASIAAGYQAEEGSSGAPELTLEGVIIASDPSNAVALVRRPGATHARAVKVGQRVYGFELLEVSDTAIWLRRGEEVIRLTLAGDWQPATRSVVADAERSGEEERADSSSDEEERQALARPTGIRRQIQRSLLEERLSREMPLILTKTGLTPRVEEGEVTGFRITRLPKGTVLDEAGIRAGDILLRINEISLNSPYALIDLYPRLQEEDEIRVLLERDGKTITLVYSFN